jgi:hypothetical protein
MGWLMRDALAPPRRKKRSRWISAAALVAARVAAPTPADAGPWRLTAEGLQHRALATMPVRREPERGEDTLDDACRLNREHLDEHAPASSRQFLTLGVGALCAPRPHDGVNGRFDPLFGARRLELGPGRLLGVLRRSNLHSPGALFELSSVPVTVTLAYRAVWLSSLRDRAGASAQFIGHFVDGSMGWALLPSNLSVEVGAASLLHGGFARAKTTTDGAQTTSLYTQLVGAM